MTKIFSCFDLLKINCTVKQKTTINQNNFIKNTMFTVK